MKSGFLQAITDEQTQTIIWDILEIEHTALLLQAAADLHIITLTACAQKQLQCTPMTSLKDIFSENTCRILSICAKQHSYAQIWEWIDGKRYQIAVYPSPYESMLLRMTVCESNPQAAAAFAEHQIAQDTAALLAQITALHAQKQEKALLRKYTLRIVRIQMHHHLLESLQAAYEPNFCRQDLRKLCDEIAAYLPENTISLQMPETCCAVYDTELMTIALCNLLSNAIAAAQSTVVLSLQHRKNIWVLSVSNDGAVVSQETIGYLLHAWKQEPKPNAFSKRKWGLGLPLIQYSIGLHHGILLPQVKTDTLCMQLVFPDTIEPLCQIGHPILPIDTGYDIPEVEFSVL